MDLRSANLGWGGKLGRSRCCLGWENQLDRKQEPIEITKWMTSGKHEKPDDWCVRNWYIHSSYTSQTLYLTATQGKRV